MSGKTISRHMLTCDGGCETTIGENGEYPTAVDSRAAAAERGWVIVPKIRSNGKPADMPDDPRRASQYFSDVCPDCRPNFQPKPLGKRGGGSTYIRDLQADNHRLREELRQRGVHV